jgi:hypothetical protein
MTKLLAGLCAILAVVSIVLAVELHRRPRFSDTKSSNPYIMFDNKTAQACWSGPADLNVQPAQSPPAGFIPDLTPNANKAGLPFCKDLR